MSMTYETALETLERCRYCLMCRHADPLSHISFNEALTPHGIALTIYSEHKGLLNWAEGSLTNVFSELDAGVARAHCATDQTFSEAVNAVKSALVDQGKLPEPVLKLKDRLERNASLFGNDRFEPIKLQNDYAVFISDETQYLWPESIEAVTTLLNALGLSPVEIARARSSGFMATSLGFIERAKTQAELILSDLETSEAKHVIVLGTADNYTFRHSYEERLGLAWPQNIQIHRLLGIILEAYKTQKLSFKTSADNRPYAYLDPSQALRTRDFDTPRQLLQTVLPGKALELFWRRERSHPTGSGSIQFTQPELAEKLTRARLEDAKDQGAEVIYCEEAADLAQLKLYAASDYGLELQGLYELLAHHLS